VNEVISRRRERKDSPLQVIEGGRKRVRVDRTTGMNHHTRKSIFDVVFKGELEIKTLRSVARLFRMDEPIILDALRIEVRNRGLVPPTPRRAA
jgi:hypothetical protein